MAEALPTADPTHPGVLVLDVGALQRYSSTMLKQLDAYHAQLIAAGSSLVLCGISDTPQQMLERTGLLAKIGPRNAIARDPHLGGSPERGLRRGREFLAGLHHKPPSPDDDSPTT